MLNLCTREKQLERLLGMKNFLYFLTRKVKVNLPLAIFNFLKKMISIFWEEMTFLIPYGRVLSELFSKLGIVRNNVEVEWTENFEYVE